MRHIQNQRVLKNYRHFSSDERLELAILLKKGYSLRDIADALGRSPSSVSRELQKNGVNGVYDPQKAKQKARTRRLYSKYQGMKIRENPVIERYIHEKMKRYWSPERIAGRLQRDYGISITHKTIYKYLYHTAAGDSLCKYLTYKQHRRRKRRDHSAWGEIIKNRVFIDARPAVINTRQRFGDFEADTMGAPRDRKETLTVMRERMSRYLLADKVPQMKYAMDGYKNLVTDVPVLSVTYDNGPENARYQELGIPTYFCHPYSSWEKGSVENGIGRIRRFIPKKANLANYTPENIRAIIDCINNMPMKCLAFRTPKEVFEEQIIALQTNKKCCTSG